MDFSDKIDYTIKVYDTKLSHDWIVALKELLRDKNLLEKNFCFLGWPKTSRNLDYLCNELNAAIRQINMFALTGAWHSAGLKHYLIEEYFTPDIVRYGEGYAPGEGHENDPFLKTLGSHIKHEVMNRLHNHFEKLQGTVWNLSDYYKIADYDTKFAIRQLNNICHEIEGLVLSQRKFVTDKAWVRPGQITTFLHAKRYDLTDEHRELFSNGYDRRFGHVYMHWSQIGKTLFEVFRDENAPKLTIGNDPTDISIGSGTTCEAINALKFYSGEFDIDWGKDVTASGENYWHIDQMKKFNEWLEQNGIDSTNKKLSLGYLPLGEVELIASFGTKDQYKIWDIIGDHLDIYQIEIDGITNTFEYCWSDPNYKQQQIDMMRPGYDHSSRR
jgi:hypothetical protein